MSRGNRPVAAWIACCTSCAAASMLRSRSNCIVIVVVPTPLVELISASPVIAANFCSSGVATDEAIVDGLAPG